MITINRKNVLKVMMAIIISLAIFVLTGFVSDLVVINYIAIGDFVHYSMYEGYADLSVLYYYIFVSALLVFNKIKGNIFVVAMTSFIVILLFKFFLLDVITHYLRFYVNTAQNGSYSLAIFKRELVNQWSYLLFELTNVGQLLSFVVWQFIALLGICYVSISIRN